MNTDEQGKKMGQVIVRAWTDEAFKKRLLEDGTAVLKEEGVSVPEAMTVKVVENSETLYHLIIPPKKSHELTDDQRNAVSGGCGQIDLRCIFDA